MIDRANTTKTPIDSTTSWQGTRLPCSIEQRRSCSMNHGLYRRCRLYGTARITTPPRTAVDTRRQPTGSTVRWRTDRSAQMRKLYPMGMKTTAEIDDGCRLPQVIRPCFDRPSMKVPERRLRLRCFNYRKETSNVIRNNSSHHRGLDADRIGAELAAQPGMGLRSQRRYRSDFAGTHHSVGDGQDIASSNVLPRHCFPAGRDLRVTVSPCLPHAVLMNRRRNA